MKKSEIYKTAQIAILQMDGLTFNNTLEILDELMEKERIYKHMEEEEKENDAV